MGRLSYSSINHFQNYLYSLKNKKRDFEVCYTNYTRKVNVFDKNGNVEFSCMFNEKGENDINVLSLINKVKKDAQHYLQLTLQDHHSDKPITFFDLFDNPEKYDILYKVDIKSAYWTYALQKGIISEKTNNYFIESYSNKPYKEAKSARLKALGSLATTKRIIKYIKGIPNYESEKITTEPTKFLYMDICRGIDDIVRECISEIEGCVYYYWDCIFVAQGFEENVVDFFKSKKFDVGIGQTKMEYIPIGHGGYLLSQEFDGGTPKMYMVRKDKKHLII